MKLKPLSSTALTALTRLLDRQPIRLHGPGINHGTVAALMRRGLVRLEMVPRYPLPYEVVWLTDKGTALARAIQPGPGRSA